MKSGVCARLVGKISTIRRCKNIRDRIFDREQLSNAIFKRAVLESISSETCILDLGCGHRASFLRSLSPFVRKAYGVDLEISESIIDDNIHIMQGDAEAIPLDDSSVDIITMINVVEHLRDPKKVFLECRRILRPGGSFFLMTPNKFYPPIFIGRALPHFIRQWANSIITSTRSEDTFRSYYKANSAKALVHICSLAGLSVDSIKYLSNHPEYFMFSTLVYRFAVAIELYVIKHEMFRWFRQRIFCHSIKPE